MIFFVGQLIAFRRLLFPYAMWCVVVRVVFRGAMLLLHGGKDNVKTVTYVFRWRGTYYLSILIYGVVVLWDKPWFTNPRNCWLDNFPRQVGICMHCSWYAAVMVTCTNWYGHLY